MVHPSQDWRDFSFEFVGQELAESGLLELPFPTSKPAIVFGDQSPQSRLYPLTKRRSEAAVPIAGNYRLVDAVLSNCINSNITKIYALTQFNSTSLNSHIARAYSGARLSKDGFVEVIAAYQSPDDNGWFQGTADAIRRCLWVLEEYPVDEFLILPGHHLYRMDYQKLIDAHRRSKAHITVSLFSTAKNEDLGFGIFKLNAQNAVLGFRENEEDSNHHFQANKHDGDEFPSMGIYVINRDVMRMLLTEAFPNVNDLKSHVIPGAISLGMKINGYLFDGYWEDMRSIEAYYRANMETIRRANAMYNFYDRDSPLYTLPRHLPPTLVRDAVITDSIIGDGCILSVSKHIKSLCLILLYCFSLIDVCVHFPLCRTQKCRIKGTVVGIRTRIGDNAVVEDSVIMGSDTYDHNGTSDGEATGIPIGIGDGSHIRKAIIDKHARIGKNVMIINKDNVQEGNREANGYIISGGIIVVIRSAMIPDGTIL
ncbi:inactive glucose-1-phosphate adenylyltransferase small subunit 2, chloroplastic-like isoform X2 [Salvia splendens]|uniref:inactive glucose-1-phosphate adenylyltransferase small subunit 2, chloroplastic-like isoform X2 n=1 Tax=Salvia splendens TaxID=180675 RepID=UPI001C270C29|nr:inactive glucose-1-phosphate adenylyltransferase small subunit 2, chloroplastic-like isoform X2 [Salvia splendens]